MQRSMALGFSQSPLRQIPTKTLQLWLGKFFIMLWGIELPVVSGPVRAKSSLILLIQIQALVHSVRIRVLVGFNPPS